MHFHSVFVSLWWWIGIPKYVKGKAPNSNPNNCLYASCSSLDLPKQNNLLLWKLIFNPVNCSNKLTNTEWKCIEDRFEKKLSYWKGKLMSYGGWLILINSVLMSMPMFLLSLFEVPVGVRKRLDFYHSRFFWQSGDLNSEYRLAKWDIICRPKDQGGLGIENLEVKNRCLLSKCLISYL